MLESRLLLTSHQQSGGEGIALSTYEILQRSVADPEVRMFLSLPDPNLLIRGTDPDPNPSIIKQKVTDPADTDHER